jgi:hypothetical protein
VSWRLEGYDTFSDEYYPLGDFMTVDGKSLDGMKPGYDTPQEALLDAQKRLDDLERTQPAASSGGQGLHGIQDRVYLVHPDGHRERVFRAARG